MSNTLDRLHLWLAKDTGFPAKWRYGLLVVLLAMGGAKVWLHLAHPHEGSRFLSGDLGVSMYVFWFVAFAFRWPSVRGRVLLRLAAVLWMGAVCVFQLCYHPA